MKQNTVIIILAAGKGERMKSELPKVLHPLCSRPMLNYVLDTARTLKAKKIITVVGYKHQEVRKVIPDSVETVLQKDMRGTADAVKQALRVIPEFKGDVLILYGDTPLLEKETIKKLLQHHRDQGAAVTLLTATLEKPDGYGRIARDEYAQVCAIVEEKDANSAQKDIKEINTGIMCFNKSSLVNVMRQIKPHNKKKEYYLTDAIGLLSKKNEVVAGMKIQNADEVMGINSRVELAKANRIMQARINEEHMRKGVTLIDPQTTFIAHGCRIGQDTTIYPFTVIARDVTIGKGCSIGPCAHIRESSRIDDQVSIGNFIEVTRSHIGSFSFAKHFSYIGDSKLGKSVNIGAGTVTANFDGVNKHTTVVKDHAFVGSDTVLIAPVTVGKGAKTAAGSIVLGRHNVPDNAVVAGVPAKLLTKERKNG
jgi:bifunctional UDP-N-acetylglucosamine pyrophosphorylase / glucosamine-1-phosphate N-acetyltransferase